ncbi:hypothetical protein L2E82_49476 [Cichorium intybus]|uniref:Uncharacterized protein n=1 Tax=Cichorium intybus TaxID=13427 RepID=A0ACB8Z1J9_CICIN|nr:hypothetical protein L2E82_49476 [Cichorium intybus]
MIETRRNRGREIWQLGEKIEEEESSQFKFQFFPPSACLSNRFENTAFLIFSGSRLVAKLVEGLYRRGLKGQKDLPNGIDIIFIASLTKLIHLFLGLVVTGEFPGAAPFVSTRCASSLAKERLWAIFIHQSADGGRGIIEANDRNTTRNGGSEGAPGL